MIVTTLPLSESVSIDIYDKVQALDYAGALQTSLFLFMVSFVVLSTVYAVNRRFQGMWPR